MLFPRDFEQNRPARSAKANFKKLSGVEKLARLATLLRHHQPQGNQGATHRVERAGLERTTPSAYLLVRPLPLLHLLRTVGAQRLILGDRALSASSTGLPE
jgi:hypothetical protein